MCDWTWAGEGPWLCGKPQKEAGGRRQAEGRRWLPQMEREATGRGQGAAADAAATVGTGLWRMRQAAEDTAQLLVRGATDSTNVRRVAAVCIAIV